MAAAIIGAIEMAFEAQSLLTEMIKDTIALFNSPEGQLIADAAMRIVADAEAMFSGHPAALQGDLKRAYAVSTLAGDAQISERVARSAIELAVTSLRAKQLAAKP